MTKAITFDEFCRKGKELHGDKFIYSSEGYEKVSQYVRMICKVCGNDFKQWGRSHLKGRGCSNCRSSKLHDRFKSSTDEVIQQFRAVQGDFYDYSKVVYVNNHTHVIIICPVHGEFSISPAHHKNGSGCRKCSTKKVNDEKIRLAGVKFIKDAINMWNGFYDYSLVAYSRSNIPVDIVCPIHGTFSMRPANHIHGKQGCPKCGHQRKAEFFTPNLSDFLDRCRIKHGGIYDYSKITSYDKSRTKMEIVCKEHGSFWQTPEMHVSGQGCPSCGSINGGLNGRLPEEEVLSVFRDEHGDRYDYSEVEYVGLRSKVKIICKEHGPFWQTANNHMRGHNCPLCANGESKAEREIADHCRSLGLTVVPRTREVMPPKELDIYIPEKKIAIEYNGLFWHSEKCKPTDGKHNQARQHMISKQKACAEKGIRLIHVGSDEPLEVVKKTLTMILGEDKKRVFARKCQVVKGTDKETVRNFLNENHVQGAIQELNTVYGLTFNDELIAVMVFSRRTSTRGLSCADGYELRRYSSSVRVVGGASRLMTAFLRDHPDCEKIVSYSDNRWFTGKMYEKLGFVNEKILGPDYRYVRANSVYPKNHFTRARMAKLKDFNFDPALSERENCINNGFYRVWDCGKTRWVREIL